MSARKILKAPAMRGQGKRTAKQWGRAMRGVRRRRTFQIDIECRDASGRPLVVIREIT